MAEMAPTAGAVHLGARYEKRAVRMGFHGIRQWLIEARPAGSAFKLRIRREKRQIAPSARERSLALFLVERTASGTFGALLTQDRVLTCRESLTPVHVGKLAIVEQFRVAHCLCPTQTKTGRKCRKRCTSRQQSAPIDHCAIFHLHTLQLCRLWCQGKSTCPRALITILLSTTVNDYVAIAMRLGRDARFRKTILAWMAEGRPPRTGHRQSSVARAHVYECRDYL